MDIEQARKIVRGYVAPRNIAINIFAQTGGYLSEGSSSLMDELANEAQLADIEMRSTKNRARRGELRKMYDELAEVLGWLWLQENKDGPVIEPQTVPTREHLISLLVLLQAHAPNGSAQEACSQMLRDMQRDGLEPIQIERQLVGALSDGLNHGNWPWVVIGDEAQVPN